MRDHLMTSSTHCQKSGRSIVFGNHIVEDVRNQEWEYRGNEVVQGATYPNIKAVKDAVRLWAISLKRELES